MIRRGLPEWLEPMAATLTDERFVQPAWTFERTRLDRLVLPRPPFTHGTGLPRLRARWARPEIVVQVAFTEWTVHGKLRHPRLVGLRTDKAARDVVRERP